MLPGEVFTGSGLGHGLVDLNSDNDPALILFYQVYLALSDFTGYLQSKIYTGVGLFKRHGSGLEGEPLDC
jgi:hypothetical protein